MPCTLCCLHSPLLPLPSSRLTQTWRKEGKQARVALDEEDRQRHERWLAGAPPREGKGATSFNEGEDGAEGSTLVSTTVLSHVRRPSEFAALSRHGQRATLAAAIAEYNVATTAWHCTQVSDAAPYFGDDATDGRKERSSEGSVDAAAAAMNAPGVLKPSIRQYADRHGIPLAMMQAAHDRGLAPGETIALPKKRRRSSIVIHMENAAGSLVQKVKSIVQRTNPLSTGGATLPAGWSVHIDESGTAYYANAATGESSWSAPAAGAAADDAAYADAPLPRGWTETTDKASGGTYWYHASTRVTTWSRPRTPATRMERTAAKRAARKARMRGRAEVSPSTSVPFVPNPHTTLADALLATDGSCAPPHVDALLDALYAIANRSGSGDLSALELTTLVQTRGQGTALAHSARSVAALKETLSVRSAPRRATAHGTAGASAPVGPGEFRDGIFAEMRREPNGPVAQWIWKELQVCSTGVRKELPTFPSARASMGFCSHSILDNASTPLPRRRCLAHLPRPPTHARVPVACRHDTTQDEAAAWKTMTRDGGKTFFLLRRGAGVADGKRKTVSRRPAVVAQVERCITFFRGVNATGASVDVDDC